MKLQRWALFRYSLEPAENGPWTLATDAEALEKRLQELEAALCETCKDPVCEDSQIGYWILKAQMYENALRGVRENSLKCLSCSASFLAEKALGGGE